MGGRNGSGNSSGLAMFGNISETWLSILAGNLLTKDFLLLVEGVKIGLFHSPCLAASSCTEVV